MCRFTISVIFSTMKLLIFICGFLLFQINAASIQEADTNEKSLQLLSEKLETTLEKFQKLQEDFAALMQKHSDGFSTSHRFLNLSHGVGIDAKPTKHIVGAPPLRDCDAIRKSGKTTSGIYTIQPEKSAEPFQVLCDMDFEGGGWTYIQKRVDGHEDFYRGWRDYRFGFGYLDKDHEFWLGLEHIYQLTDSQINELMVEIVDRDGEKTYALYKHFAIGQEEDAYPLKTLDGYSGDAGDALTYHKGMKFSTFDLDQDNSSTNCAQIYQGAWWYNQCLKSNLNGKFVNVDLPKIYNNQCLIWSTNKEKDPIYCHAKVRMMIRPSSF